MKGGKTMTKKEWIQAILVLIVFIAIIALGGMIDQSLLADGYIH